MYFKKLIAKYNQARIWKYFSQTFFLKHVTCWFSKKQKQTFWISQPWSVGISQNTEICRSIAYSLDTMNILAVWPSHTFDIEWVNYKLVHIKTISVLLAGAESIPIAMPSVPTMLTMTCPVCPLFSQYIFENLSRLKDGQVYLRYLVQ
jgi:hypothetical protein